MPLIEPLSRAHDREGFDCGIPALNEFLRQTARQRQERGLSRTFVLTEPDRSDLRPILGFFTLAATECLTESLPTEVARRLPSRIPAVTLARLAIDTRHQRKGFGATLVAEAFVRVASIADQLGVAGLFVDAKDDIAAAFYAKFGFLPLTSTRLRLFLPLATIRRFIQ